MMNSEMKNDAIIEYAKTGSVMMKVGLGAMLWINNAPSITAVTMSPGIPSAIIVIRAPPSVALLEDSGAMIPSGVPVPNFSGCLDAFFAWSYAKMLAMVPPAPGNIPTKMPISDERINVVLCLMISPVD